MSNNWEYKIIEHKKDANFLIGSKLNVETLEAQLNQLGYVGWELISATPNLTNSRSNDLVLILKRKR